MDGILVLLYVLTNTNHSGLQHVAGEQNLVVFGTAVNAN